MKEAQDLRVRVVIIMSVAKRAPACFRCVTNYYQLHIFAQNAAVIPFLGFEEIQTTLATKSCVKEGIFGRNQDSSQYR